MLSRHNGLSSDNVLAWYITILLIIFYTKFTSNFCIWNCSSLSLEDHYSQNSTYMHQIVYAVPFTRPFFRWISSLVEQSFPWSSYNDMCIESYPSGHLVWKWRRINVDATSSRRIDVNTTSFWHQMPAGTPLELLCELESSAGYKRNNVERAISSNQIKGHLSFSSLL